jgi:hypothetical protein
MTRFFEDRLTLRIACESPDEYRALYRALFQAKHKHKTEAERLRLRLGSGYGSDADRIVQGRESTMERMVDRLLVGVDTEMKAANIEPW